MWEINRGNGQIYEDLNRLFLLLFFESRDRKMKNCNSLDSYKEFFVLFI